MTLPESSSFSSYGGEKEEAFAVIDASTQRSNTEINNCFADTAAMTRTTPRGWVQFDISDGYASLSNSTSWDTVWKGATSTPPVFETVSTGFFTITFPTSVNNELGDTYTTNIKWSKCHAVSAPGFMVSNSEANVITVELFDTSGVESNFNGETFVVEFY